MPPFEGTKIIAEAADQLPLGGGSLDGGDDFRRKCHWLEAGQTFGFHLETLVAQPFKELVECGLLVFKPLLVGIAQINGEDGSRWNDVDCIRLEADCPDLRNPALRFARELVE